MINEEPGVVPVYPYGLAVHPSLSDCRMFTSVVSAVCQENATVCIRVCYAKRVQSLWQRVRDSASDGDSRRGG